MAHSPCCPMAGIHKTYADLLNPTIRLLTISLKPDRHLNTDWKAPKLVHVNIRPTSDSQDESSADESSDSEHEEKESLAAHTPQSFSYRELVFVELDGVVANCSKGLRTNIKGIKYFQPGHVRFRDLPVVEGASEAITTLRSLYDVWFVSTPSSGNIETWSEKAEWVCKHFGQHMVDRLILCPHKFFLSGRGKVLIDSSEENGAAEFRNEAGFPALITFGSATYPDWTAVLKELCS